MYKVSIEDFIEYVKMFYYGPDALYPYPWTKEQIAEGCYVRYNMEGQYEGDTIDREWTRDYLIERFGE